MSSIQRSFARQRLLKEYRSVQDDIANGEFATSHGTPALVVNLVDGDVFRWHIVISPQAGNFQGLRLHATMNFFENFPSSPPDIGLDTNIPHSNTFGDVGQHAWICLDLLSAGSQQRFGGWTPAYSISALLRQFQTFLFDEWVRNNFPSPERVWHW